MVAFLHGLDAAKIAQAGAPIFRGVAVEQFLPVPAERHADPVILARNRREIAHHQDDVAGRFALAQKAQGARFGIVGIDPLEPGREAIQLMQRGLGTVKAVHVAHPLLAAGLGQVIDVVPVEAGIVLPFLALAELAAHEEQLLAGLGEHVAE